MREAIPSEIEKIDEKLTERKADTALSLLIDRNDDQDIRDFLSDLAKTKHDYPYSILPYLLTRELAENLAKNPFKIEEFLFTMLDIAYDSAYTIADFKNPREWFSYKKSLNNFILDIVYQIYKDVDCRLMVKTVFTSSAPHILEMYNRFLAKKLKILRINSIADISNDAALEIRKEMVQAAECLLDWETDVTDLTSSQARAEEYLQKVYSNWLDSNLLKNDYSLAVRILRRIAYFNFGHMQAECA